MYYSKINNCEQTNIFVLRDFVADGFQLQLVL